MRAPTIKAPPWIIPQVADVEAKPFYSGFRLKFSGTGTRFAGVPGNSITEAISYVLEYTWTRAPFNVEVGSFYASTADPKLLIDVGLGAPIADDMCVIKLENAFINNIGQTFVSPNYQPIYISLGDSTTDPLVVVGTRTTDYTGIGGSSTTTNLEEYLYAVVPTFFHSDAFSLPAGRYLLDNWNTTGIDGDGPDITAWSIAKWHDIRGIYNETFTEPLGTWDTNDVVHTTEWEIL